MANSTSTNQVTPEMIDEAIAQAEQEKKDAAKRVRRLKRLKESHDELQALAGEVTSAA